jgi:hypothetical protein
MPSKQRLSRVLLLSCLAACAADPAGARKDRTQPAPAAPVDDPELARLPLAERLQREAERHPAARAHADALFERLARGDLELVRTRQVLAAPLGADYCAAALSKRGVGLSVCEFADAERAERGLRRSRESFDRLIPGRTLLVNGATLFTLTRAPGIEAEAEHRRLAAAFAGTEHAAL